MGLEEDTALRGVDSNAFHTVEYLCSLFVAAKSGPDTDPIHLLFFFKRDFANSLIVHRQGGEFLFRS